VPGTAAGWQLNFRSCNEAEQSKQGFSFFGVHGAGIVLTGIPQLPLTTLNSVVAVCQLSEDLFPAKPVRPVLVSVSVGLMNMVGAWFGAMPCCHGAGGLAAQVRHEFPLVPASKILTKVAGYLAVQNAPLL